MKEKAKGNNRKGQKIDEDGTKDEWGHNESVFKIEKTMMISKKKGIRHETDNFVNSYFSIYINAHVDQTKQKPTPK